MGRKTSFNDPARQIVQTSEDQHKYDTPTFRRLEVNAQPVNMFVTPNVTQQANTLALSLSEAAPALAMLNMSVNHQYHDSKIAEGQAAAFKDIGLPEEDKQKFSWFSSPSFVRGYDSVSSMTAGMEDRQKLKADFAADPERNTMTTQEWLGNWMRKNQPQGMSGTYINGWNQEMLPEVKAITLQGAQDKVADGVALVNQKKNEAFKATIDDGWNPESADKLKITLQGDGTKDKPGLVAMTNADWDREVLAQVDQYIEAGGDPDKARKVLTWAKSKRPDGTPGIYEKPGMAKVVNDLWDKAYSVSLQKTRLEESMDREGRIGDTADAYRSILEVAKTNPAAARKQLEASDKANPGLWNPGRYLSTMKLINEFDTVRKHGQGEGNSAALTKLVVEYGNGKIDADAGLDALTQGQINLSQYSHFLSLTGAMSKKVKEIYKTPQFEDAQRTLNAIPREPGQDTFDLSGKIKSAYRANYDGAVIELRQRVAENPQADPMVIANEIKDRRLKLVDSGALRDPGYVDYVSKYQTKEAFLKDYDAGKIDANTKSMEIKYWQWMDNLARKKGIKQNGR